MKDPVSLYDWMPLPYDNELREMELSDQDEMNNDMKVIYMEAYANNYFNRPIEEFANGR